MIHLGKVPNGSSHLRSLLCSMIFHDSRRENDGTYQNDPLKVFGTKLGHLLSAPNCRKTRYDMTRYSSFVAYAGRCHIKTRTLHHLKSPCVCLKSPCV